ncbi:MAG: AbrB/MazE/SpoVT family DNA-binding domain-containing protein [Candidatus Bathyarchaeia archaeon]
MFAYSSTSYVTYKVSAIYKLVGNMIGNLIYKLHLNLPTEINNLENLGEITKLTLAKTKSESLRTTVPMSVVRQFGLKAGDKMSWKLEAKNGEMIIVLRPIKVSRGK